MNFTDPGLVCVSGQNPFMMLFADGVPVTLASFWRVELSPVGKGHVLFLKAALTDDHCRVYTDAPALATYFQSEIYARNPGPFSVFRDAGAAVIEATFATTGDPRTSVTEQIDSKSDRVILTWSDFCPAFKGGTGADPAKGRAHAHYALYVPARKVSLVLNSQAAAGDILPIPRDGRDFTSAGLALAETWTLPPV